MLFKNGGYDLVSIITLILCFALLALFAVMLLLVIKKDKKLGIAKDSNLTEEQWEEDKKKQQEMEGKNND